MSLAELGELLQRAPYDNKKKKNQHDDYINIDANIITVDENIIEEIQQQLQWW